MAAAGKMGRVPMLTGGPAKQANKAMIGGTAMPKRTAAKPAKAVTGTPPSVPVNKATKQPKGKGKVRVSKGSVKNAPGKNMGI